MPKRRHDSKEEKWRKKIRKYEQKLSYWNVTRDSPYEDSLDGQGSGGEGPSWRVPPSRSHSRTPPTPEAASLLGDNIPPIAAAALSDPEPPVPTTNSPPRPLTPPLIPVASIAVTDAVQTSADITVEEGISTADPELLKALGHFEAESADWGPDIVPEIGLRWEPILREGLKKETREDLLKKYLLPKNCPLVKAPTLNPEITAMLNDSARSRDNRVWKKQAQLGCVLSILGKTMTNILTKASDPSETLRLLSDATKLLSDSHYLETETRRSLVTPMIDKTLLEQFRNRKRDGHLFGDNLGEFIKSSRGIQKTGKLIQSAPTASHLNFKGPSSSRQHQQRSFRPHLRRGAAG